MFPFKLLNKYPLLILFNQDRLLKPIIIKKQLNYKEAQKYTRQIYNTQAKAKEIIKKA